MSFLLQPRIVSLIGLILVVAVVILGGLALDRSGSDIALVAAIAVLAYAAIFLFIQYRAVKASQGLEQSLLSAAQDQAAGARPDQRAAIDDLRKQFDESLGLLRQSRMGKGALHSMPWYVIIGPPGSGKTTLLRESGINFPYMRSRTEIRGLGGTRNCDWWFGERAIMLDTAGRWMTEFEDRDEWLSFLGMLKKGRGREALNGAVIGISLADIVTASDTELKNYADNCRDRLDELTRSLDVIFPVYLVFTKCDLIGGFVEFFSPLSASERKQVWGFTLPYKRSKDFSFEDAFRNELNGLYGKLKSVRLEALSRLRTPKKPLIYKFPLQFDLAKERVEQFVALLNQDSPYQEASRLRGCYFTSGTQEGTAIDQLSKDMAEWAQIEIDVPPDERKCYFVDDVFEKVVFEDHDLAEPTLASSKRQRLMRRVGSVGVAVAAVVLAWLIVQNYLANRSAVGGVEKAANAIFAAGKVADGRAREAAFATSLYALLEELDGRDNLRELEGDTEGSLSIHTRALLHEKLRKTFVQAAAKRARDAASAIAIDVEVPSVDWEPEGLLEQEAALEARKEGISREATDAQRRFAVLSGVYSLFCSGGSVLDAVPETSGAAPLSEAEVLEAAATFWPLLQSMGGIQSDAENQSEKLFAYFCEHRGESSTARNAVLRNRLGPVTDRVPAPASPGLAESASEAVARIDRLLAEIRQKRPVVQWFPNAQSALEAAEQQKLELEDLQLDIVGLTTPEISSENVLANGGVGRILEQFALDVGSDPVQAKRGKTWMSRYRLDALNDWQTFFRGCKRSGGLDAADVNQWFANDQLGTPSERLYRVAWDSLSEIVRAEKGGVEPSPTDPESTRAGFKSNLRSLKVPFEAVMGLTSTSPFATVKQHLDTLLEACRDTKLGSDSLERFFGREQLRVAFAASEAELRDGVVDTAVTHCRSILDARWTAIATDWNTAVRGRFPFRDPTGGATESDLGTEKFKSIFAASGAQGFLGALSRWNPSTVGGDKPFALNASADEARRKLQVIADQFIDSAGGGLRFEIVVKAPAADNVYRFQAPSVTLSEETLSGSEKTLSWMGTKHDASLSIETRTQGQGNLGNIVPAVGNAAPFENKDWACLRLLHLARLGPIREDADWATLTWMFKIQDGDFPFSLEVKTVDESGLEEVIGQDATAFEIDLPTTLWKRE